MPLILRTASLLLAGALLAGCAKPPPPRELSCDDPSAVFASLDAQLDHYLEHGLGDSDCVDRLAAHGRPLAPILERRLAALDEEPEQIALIRVLAAMQREGTYPVRDDPRLTDLLLDKVGAMQLEFWREEGKALLAEILAAAPGTAP